MNAIGTAVLTIMGQCHVSAVIKFRKFYEISRNVKKIHPNGTTL